MVAKGTPRAAKLSVKVNFVGASGDETLPGARVYAFDSSGRLVGSEPVRGGGATLGVPEAAEGQRVRIVVGPELDDPGDASRKLLARRSAVEKRIQLGPGSLEVAFDVADGVWRLWPLCRCVVRGRLVRRWNLPDGTVRQLPICNARVTVCEVDRIPWIIWKLPDDLLVRIRDELLREIRKPVIPPPPPPPLRVPPPPPPPWTAAAAASDQPLALASDEPIAFASSHPTMAGVPQLKGERRHASGR
ncbi:MAG: hypothetical protein ACRDKW_01315 [Actinomycetota bacterium]